MVGLGNPGEEYQGTRHNVGEAAVRRWAESEGLSLTRHKSLGVTARVPGTAIELAVPSGYMNSSGAPVSALARYFKVDPEHVVVIHDDLDLEAGVIRLKRGGGHGGHNGLRDIERALGSSDFSRVRIGIGRPPGRMDPARYVLAKISSRELEQWTVTLEEAVAATRLLISQGLGPAQQVVHAP